MPAPDHGTILQFEDAIETAVVTVLTANGMTAMRQRGSTSLATPRVEVRLMVGAAEEHYGRGAGNEPFLDFWHGTIQLAIVTNRSRNDASHMTYRGKCRYAMQGLTALNSALDYLAFSRVLESGTSPEIHADENHDATVVSFAVDFCVRADAWPV